MPTFKQKRTILAGGLSLIVFAVIMGATAFLRSGDSWFMVAAGFVALVGSVFVTQNIRYHLELSDVGILSRTLDDRFFKPRFMPWDDLDSVEMLATGIGKLQLWQEGIKLKSRSGAKGIYIPMSGLSRNDQQAVWETIRSHLPAGGEAKPKSGRVQGRLG